MKTYPPGLQRLLELARRDAALRSVVVDRPEGPPHGFATRVAARWLAPPVSFSADLERFARWAAAIAVCLCLVVAKFGVPHSPGSSELPLDFLGESGEIESR